MLCDIGLGTGKGCWGRGGEFPSKRFKKTFNPPPAKNRKSPVLFNYLNVLDDVTFTSSNPIQTLTDAFFSKSLYVIHIFCEKCAKCSAFLQSNYMAKPLDFRGSIQKIPGPICIARIFGARMFSTQHSIGSDVLTIIFYSKKK